jgi:hypothetical protein
MANQGDLALFASAAFVLIFASMFATYAIESTYGVTINSPDFGFQHNSVSSAQDFTNSTSYNSNNVITSGIFVSSGNWKQIDNTGYELMENYYLSQPELLIDNVISDNGVYDITYYIYNPTHKAFWLYPRYTEPSNMIELRFDSDGIHIPDYITYIGLALDDHFYYADPNVLNYDSQKIETILDTNANTLTVYQNDILEFTTDKGIKDSGVSIQSYYFAGVASQTQGFTLQKITGVFAQYSTGASTGDAAFKDTSWLGYALTLLKIVTYNIPGAYFPWWANMVCIDFPALICFVFGLKLLRGN